MKRLFSSWQGLAAGAIAILIWFLSPLLIRAIDPSAGSDDAGQLQWILFAACQFFAGIFVVWAGWQIAFRSMDAWADKYLRSAFENLPEPFKLLMVQASFVVMLIYWVACLFIQPRQ